MTINTGAEEQVLALPVERSSSILLWERVMRHYDIAPTWFSTHITTPIQRACLALSATEGQGVMAREALGFLDGVALVQQDLRDEAVYMATQIPEYEGMSVEELIRNHLSDVVTHMLNNFTLYLPRSLNRVLAEHFNKMDVMYGISPG